MSKRQHALSADDIDAMIEGHQVHRDVYISQSIYELEMPQISC